MTGEMQRLRSKCGHVIREACLEKVLFYGNSGYNLRRVGVVFDDGASFTFGCAGTGAVSVHRGHCSADWSAPDVIEVKLDHIPSLESAILQAVRFEHDLMVLESSGGALFIRNEDDELVVATDRAIGI